MRRNGGSLRMKWRIKKENKKGSFTINVILFLDKENKKEKKKMKFLLFLTILVIGSFATGRAWREEDIRLNNYGHYLNETMACKTCGDDAIVEESYEFVMDSLDPVPSTTPYESTILEGIYTFICFVGISFFSIGTTIMVISLAIQCIIFVMAVPFIIMGGIIVCCHGLFKYILRKLRNSPDTNKKNEELSKRHENEDELLERQSFEYNELMKRHSNEDAGLVEKHSIEHSDWYSRN